MDLTFKGKIDVLTDLKIWINKYWSLEIDEIHNGNTFIKRNDEFIFISNQGEMCIRDRLMTEGDGEDKDMMFEIPIDDTFVDNIAVTSDIRIAISKLSKSEKEIIFKRFWEEKSQVMISKELGISQAGISRRLRKALNSISSDIGIGGCLLYTSF